MATERMCGARFPVPITLAGPPMVLGTRATSLHRSIGRHEGAATGRASRQPCLAEQRLDAPREAPRASPSAPGSSGRHPPDPRPPGVRLRQRPSPWTRETHKKHGSPHERAMLSSRVSAIRGHLTHAPQTQAHLDLVLTPLLTQRPTCPRKALPAGTALRPPRDLHPSSAPCLLAGRCGRSLQVSVVAATSQGGIQSP